MIDGRVFLFSMTALLLPALAAAQAATPPPPLVDPVDKPGPRVVPGFDPAALDRTVEPCADFYKFACGGWLAKNPVPPDRARWGRFDELSERNQATLRAILEKAAASPADQKIGDYYQACMDEKGIEAMGLRPIKSTLDRIAAIKSKGELAAEIGRLHLQGVDAPLRLRLAAGLQGLHAGHRRPSTRAGSASPTATTT